MKKKLSLPPFSKQALATNTFNPFNIQFSGLKIGSHSFDFDLDASFFKDIENTLISEGSIQIKLTLDKQANMLQLHFTFEGHLDLVCDRCAGNYNYPVQGQAKLTVKFGTEDLDSDDLVILSPGEHELNIKQYVYEMLALSIPFRVVPCEDYPENGYQCDEEVLSKLKNISVNEIEPDARWDALKKLK